MGATLLLASCSQRLLKLIRRFEGPVGDQRAVSFVDRGSEQGGRKNFQILTLVCTSIADERHCLAKRFDDGGDQEVAAELDEIRGFRRLGDDKSPPSDPRRKRIV